MYRTETCSLELMLWSMRNNSSRQSVGVGTALLNAQLPGEPVVGSGNCGSSGTAVGSIGTRLLVNGLPVAGLIGQSPMLPLGSGQSSVKSPKLLCGCEQSPPKPRSAQEGTGTLKSVDRRLRRHSSEKKKKVLVRSWL